MNEFAHPWIGGGDKAERLRTPAESSGLREIVMNPYVIRWMGRSLSMLYNFGSNQSTFTGNISIFLKGVIIKSLEF